jgi:hypothetical protein
LSVVAQQENADSKQDKLLPPAEEEFADVDAIASPWRVGTCPDASYKIPNCHEVSYENLHKLTRTSIYSEDGSLWYVYSNHHYDPDFYKKNKTINFLPFAGYGDFGRNALLRMVGESKHWYKVEVNEQSQATKFILKSDPNWEKTTWDLWLAKIGQFTIDENDKTAIYDKPNGNVIGQADNTGMRYFRYFGKLSKRDGDWLYVQVSKDGYSCYPVEAKSEKCYPGWIRWREDRKFLVKPDNILFTLTEIKPTAKNR